MSKTEDDIVLAAEYVLGTLDADELTVAERLVEEDPEFAALVRDWERRLGELNALVGAVEPPTEQLAKIKARIESVAQPATIHLPDPASAPRAAPSPAFELRAPRPPSASPPDLVAPVPDQRGQVIALAGSMRKWRVTGGLMAAIAAGLAALFVTSLVQPDLLPKKLRPPPQIVEVEKTVEKVVEKPADKPSRFVAVLQKDAASPAFILTVDVDARTVMVRRVAAEAQTDKSYQLWLVSDKFPAPRSLGLIGDQEFTPAQLASDEPEALNDATYAVSLEPTGGSPTGQPTGPVLWSGKLIEATPPAGNP